MLYYKFNLEINEIYFRTDANQKIGTGHLSRCLSLANELRKKGAKCEFICRDLENYYRNLIKKINLN